jgi:hypothetical protein
MIDMANNSGCTVRVVVKLRPDQYDELIRHVREIGSTMSAFFRESATKAMKEGHSDRADSCPDLEKWARDRTFGSGCKGALSPLRTAVSFAQQPNTFALGSQQCPELP